jgi:cytochrome c oxidase subunit III
MRAPLLRDQFEDLDKQAHAARLGMWAFLGSELLLFAALFTLYAAYRVLYPVDFALAVEHNNVLIGTTNTVVLITSSLTVALGLHSVRQGRGRLAAALFAVSILAGLVFLLLKGIEYAQHFHEGIFPGTAYRFAELPTVGAGLFFTLYFLMTGLHALHVIAGMGLLTWVSAGSFSGAFSPARSIHVELCALYWHLVDVVWIFLWPLLYLMHR